MFTPHRIPIEEARPGDTLIFKRSGLLALVLSWLIQKLKEPHWDRWGWHMGAVVSPGWYMNAQMFRLKISRINADSREIHCYRMVESPPEFKDISEFTKDYVGKPYDWFVYIPTGLWALHIPIPRIINSLYNCWEVAFGMCEYIGVDIDKSDRKYPFLTDFLRYVGELK